jgi:hypothetical protein
VDDPAVSVYGGQVATRRAIIASGNFRCAESCCRGKGIWVIRTSRGKSQAVKVTFVLPIEQPVGVVSVVGDFNEWRPGVHELRKRSNGTRSASIEVEPGTTLRFRYLGSDGHWFDDPHAHEHDHLGGVFVAS